MNRIEQKVFELAEMPAKEIGCYIYDVEYLKEGADWYLRIYADKAVSYTHLDVYKRQLFILLVAPFPA